MPPYSAASAVLFSNVEYDGSITNGNNKEVTRGRLRNYYKSRLKAIKTYTSQLKWFNIILITIIHSVFVWEVTYGYPWSKSGRLILFNYILGVASAFGINAGAHRLWSHRTYKANLPLRVILMLLYCLAGHNPLFNWVRDHRVHHKYTETNADPHNSRRGFFFSHVGWLMLKKHPDVIRKGKKIDMSDLWADPVIRFHQKYYVPLVLTVGFIIPTIIPPICWGSPWYSSFITACVGRYVIVLNMTWLVNSAAHMWGTKPFDKNISPTDNLTVSLMSVGEGWHNYHHAFPWDYKAAELGRHSVNLSTMFIDIFAKIGWAYDLKTASPTSIKNLAKRLGDGTHPLWGNTEVPDMGEEELFQARLYDDNRNARKEKFAKMETQKNI